MLDVSLGGTASIAALAEALFCSPLRPENQPDPDQVRAAVQTSLLEHDNDPDLCACDLAQAYGDCPEITVIRMRWCLDTVTRAFSTAA